MDVERHELLDLSPLPTLPVDVEMGAGGRASLGGQDGTTEKKKKDFPPQLVLPIEYASMAMEEHFTFEKRTVTVTQSNSKAQMKQFLDAILGDGVVKWGVIRRPDQQLAIQCIKKKKAPLRAQMTASPVQIPRTAATATSFDPSLTLP